MLGGLQQVKSSLVNSLFLLLFILHVFVFTLMIVPNLTDGLFLHDIKIFFSGKSFF